MIDWEDSVSEMALMGALNLTQYSLTHCMGLVTLCEVRETDINPRGHNTPNINLPTLPIDNPPWGMFC